MKNLFSRFALSAKESASESIEAVVEGLKSSVETEEATEDLDDMSIKWRHLAKKSAVMVATTS